MSWAQIKPRNRLYSDSSNDIPKSILKKPRIPTKRSVSECVDNLSDVMNNLNLNISDLPQSRGEFCYHNNFHEEDEEGGDDDSESDTENHEQKKFVRFDDKVYETVFLASRLYDKRSMTKYHFSSRHHPSEQQKKRRTKKSSSSSTKVDDQTAEISCKQSKSQRSKQSKRDKKKRLNKRDDTNDTGSGDDQGYHSSSHHSFSD